MNFFNFLCSQKVTMLAPEFFTVVSIHIVRIDIWTYLDTGLDIQYHPQSTTPDYVYGDNCEKLRSEHGHFL